jgi:hypothetical protein
MRLHSHKHREALELIMRTLEQHKSSTITLRKIKAHASHIGNEMVDAGAKYAANCKAEEHDLLFPADPAPGYAKGRYWIYNTKNPGSPTALKITRGPQQTQAQLPKSICDLRQSLADHMHDVHKLGKSNTDSIYYRAWQGTRPCANPTLSNSFFQSASHHVKRTVLQYRTGTIWNAKLAYRNGKCASPACPLCGNDDGGGHIAGGCSCKDMQLMYVERHNVLGRILLRAIAKGGMGGNLVAADVGSSKKCLSAQAPVIGCNHAPDTLLPARSGATAAEKKVHAASLRRLKPDIMLVVPAAGPATGSKVSTRDHTNIYIAELKCCPDTQRSNQLAKSREQHLELQALLVAAGYNAGNIHVIPVLVGHSGTIYTDHTLQAMETLGIPRQKAEKCARKIHSQVTSFLDSIVRTRRRLEHERQSCPNPP